MTVYFSNIKDSFLGSMGLIYMHQLETQQFITALGSTGSLVLTIVILSNSRVTLRLVSNLIDQNHCLDLIARHCWPFKYTCTFIVDNQRLVA